VSTVSEEVQSSLFPWMRDEVEPMTELVGLITIVDVIGLEVFIFRSPVMPSRQRPRLGPCR
jgi:hypothetical protein